MNLYQRAKNIIAGVVTILYGLAVIFLSDIGYLFMVLILSFYLFFQGIRMLIYYFTMTRLMVGGKSVLFKGIILLEAAMFTATMSNIKPLYLILYLVGIYAVTGVIDILRSLEEKKCDAPSWKLKFTFGMLNIVIAAAAAVSGIFFGSVKIPVYIYGGGMIWSGLVNIISAFRKRPAIYIQ